MSNHSNSDINNYPTLPAVIEDNAKESIFFTINSQKASEILGVNKTRLSQLTSQGVFPYERRKVDARSRLFYRLNDLLNYQRKSSFGNLSAQTSEESKALVPLLPAADLTVENHQVLQTIQQKKIGFSYNPKKQKINTLQKALDVKNIAAERIKSEKTNHALATLEQTINKMMTIIVGLECQIAQLRSNHLSRKKSMFHRPRPKRVFKTIKR